MPHHRIITYSKMCNSPIILLHIALLAFIFSSMLLKSLCVLIVVSDSNGEDLLAS